MKHPTETATTVDVAQILRQCLEQGRAVQIDGLGRFRAQGKGHFRFIPETKPRVFIAYVEENLAEARRLCRYMARAGFKPWLDREKLQAGQNWPRAIERAIGLSDYVIACFSHHAEVKRGHFQAELRYALDCARRMPLEETFLIPVRLDECTLPLPIVNHIQYVDLFPDWEAGCQQIVHAMERRKTS